MAINPSSFINSYFGAGNSLISEETRRKLIALGIDPATVTSEAQAKILIQNVQKARKMEAENLSSSEIDTKEQNSEVVKINENFILQSMNFEANINKIILGL